MWLPEFTNLNLKCMITDFLSPCTNKLSVLHEIIDERCGFALHISIILVWITIYTTSYHTLQTVWAEANEVHGKEKNRSESRLKIAFDIDTSGDDVTLRCSACNVSWVCREPSVPSQSECITNVQ